MKIEVTTSYTLKFYVCRHWGTEGGMDCEYFGKEVETLSEALTIWDAACNSTSTTDWIIECGVQRSIKDRA